MEWEGSHLISHIFAKGMDYSSKTATDIQVILASTNPPFAASNGLPIAQKWSKLVLE